MPERASPPRSGYTCIGMAMTKHFSNKELQCKCGCGQMLMDWAFMDRIEMLRVACKHPLPVSSAYRCPDYNSKTSKTGTTGPHTTGKSIDLIVCGEKAYNILLLAFHFGFSGIGVSQRGPHGHRYIHLDDLTFPDYPRPRVWSY